MTVKEYITMLQKLPQDFEVKLVCCGADTSEWGFGCVRYKIVDSDISYSEKSIHLDLEVIDNDRL